jgi:hypothetical protein
MWPASGFAWGLRAIACIFKINFSLGGCRSKARPFHLVQQVQHQTVLVHFYFDRHETCVPKTKSGVLQKKYMACWRSFKLLSERCLHLAEQGVAK